MARPPESRSRNSQEYLVDRGCEPDVYRLFKSIGVISTLFTRSYCHLAFIDPGYIVESYLESSCYGIPTQSCVASYPSVFPASRWGKESEAQSLLKVRLTSSYAGFIIGILDGNKRGVYTTATFGRLTGMLTAGPVDLCPGLCVCMYSVFDHNTPV